MRVTASCTGSCGELIQGWLGNSQKLVSYGIDRFSKVTLQTGIASKGAKPKVEKAINKTLDHLRIPTAKREKLSFVINSELPIAKGMASSTADIAAACQATTAYYGRKITRDEIIDICLAIERTDSILFPTLTLFEQKNGSVRESSGWAPHFYVVVLEPEETLETEAFHSQVNERLIFQQRALFTEVYQCYVGAVKEKSLQMLGKAATHSAILNQEILAKPYFSELMKLRQHHQWLGVNVAHSGSVVGIMIEKPEDIPAVLETIKKSNVSRWYSKVSVHQSCYRGVELIEARKMNEEANDRGCFQRLRKDNDNAWLNETFAKSRVSSSTL